MNTTNPQSRQGVASAKAWEAKAAKTASVAARLGILGEESLAIEISSDSREAGRLPLYAALVQSVNLRSLS